MTDHGAHSGSDEPQGDLAAEYVVGVLDASARREVERRMAEDPGFAAEVAAWEERLTPLVAAVPPIEPPPAVWRAIARRLGLGQSETASARSSLWESLSFWRTLGIASSALAAASLFAVAVLLRPTAAPTPALVATLQATGAAAASFVARVDRERATLLVVPTAALAADGRAAELWLIPPGVDPQPLGLLDPARPVTLTIPARLVPHATRDAVLAVSLEPPGGSPTGKPTGPVIAQGALTNL